MIIFVHSAYLKVYVVTPHLNRLIETVQMRGSQHTASMRNKKNYPSVIIKYSGAPVAQWVKR